MAEDFSRSKGTSSNYKFNRGEGQSDPGPYVGIVKNNVDPTRSGRLQVYIEQFGGPNPEDPSNWRTVSYLAPFYGSTNTTANIKDQKGTGQFVTNKHSYGMWFTPPDLGVRVMCFFVAGDPNTGYYVGCLPEDSLTHMVPAVGATKNFKADDKIKQYVGDATQLPVVEINDQDRTINEDPRFFDKEKPVHSVLASVLYQQGLHKDTIRGPITSTSQRETPSAVYGVSTPGRPIYRSGIQDDNATRAAANLGNNKKAFEVIGRRGGHSFVMDDGDINGNNNLIRIRTSKGHQITMSDDGDAFYFVHANGQSWIEMGKEGTVDVYSTNSVNVRTNGSMNFHADKDINMFAGNKINMMSNTATTVESEGSVGIRAQREAKMYSKNFVGIKGDASVGIKAGKAGSFDGGDKLDLKAGCIGLNSGGTIPVQAVQAIRKNRVADVTYSKQGWKQEFGKLQTIVNRAPTHEPWPFHGLGIENSVDYDASEQDNKLPDDVQTTLTVLKSFTPNNTIQTSDFAVSDKPEIRSAGSVDVDELRGMMAQAVKDVGQALDIYSVDKGVGKYGLTLENLELAGYLKPNVAKRFVNDNTYDTLNAVLKSTNSWTGKNGADSVGEFLGNADLQARVQQDLYLNTLSKLKASGIVRGTENSKDLGPLLQAGAKHGVKKVVEWAKGGTPLGPDGQSLTTAIKNTAKNAEYAINYVNEKLKIDTKVYGAPGNYKNTTSRKNLDKDVNEIINDKRIDKPKYTDDGTIV